MTFDLDKALIETYDRVNGDLVPVDVGPVPPVGEHALIPANQSKKKEYSTGHITSADTLLTEPPPADYILYYKDQGIIEKGIVGAIAATGGTGKTFWLYQLGLSLSSGRSFGPLKPAGKYNVLYVNAEDAPATTDRRIWSITNGNIPERFKVFSIVGCEHNSAIMEMDGKGNPAMGEGYEWLSWAIEKNDVDVLFLDPMARFFGLEENDNRHGTAFVKAIERISKQFGVTILTAHHTNEESQKAKGRMNKTMFRGASSLTDGIRWAAGMRKMTEEAAESLKIPEGEMRQYIEWDIIKNNGGHELPRSIFFRQNSETGAFESVDPGAERLGHLAGILVDAIAHDNATNYGRNDLVRDNAGKKIRDELSAEYEDFNARNEMGFVIDHCLFKGMLQEITPPRYGSGKPKPILVSSI